MKIIHFVYADKVSGLEILAMNILSELAADHEVYYAAPEGEGLERARSMGINAVACDTSSPTAIKRTCKEMRPDVVHAHDPHVSFNCALANVEFVSHLHCNCAWLSKICPNSIALLYAVIKAKKVICVSDSIVNEFLFRRVMKPKAVVLSNYVDKDIILNMASSEEAEGYDLCSVARMNENKNPLAFLELVAMLKKKKPDVTAVMIGDGELMDTVKSAVSERGLEDNVTLKGYMKNPYPLVKASRVGVLTSDNEGFGLVAVEAMLLSKPFVARNVGGLPLIVDNTCGGVFDTVEDMAEEIYKLLTDEEYYSSKASSAGVKAKAFTCKDEYISRLMEAYE